MAVFDILCSIGAEVMMDKFKSKGMEVKARKQLEEYLSRQEKINKLCTRDEEIDFQKLSDYILKELIADMEKRFYGDKKERAIARNHILHKAKYYAHTQCRISEKRAEKIIDDAMSILKGFFRGKINKDTLLVTGEIEDVVEESADRLTSTIENSIAQLKRVINENCALSLERNMAQIDAGQLDAVADNLSTFMDQISTRHCLYPHYGFRMGDGGVLVSTPRSDDALKQYPPKMTMKISDIRIGDRPVPAGSDFLDTSYRFQQPVCFRVNDAVKFLGDTYDPDQHEAKEAIGSYLVLTPPKFTEDNPVRMCVDGETFFDYVPLKLRKILDDGTRVMTNEDHMARIFDITYTYLPPDKPFTVTITPKSASTHDMLKFCRYMKRTNEGGILEFCDLETGKRRAAGTQTVAKASHSDALMSTVEKLIDIEKYFKIRFCINGILSDRDLWLAKCLHTLIAGGELEGSWEKEEFSFTIDGNVRAVLSGLEDICYTPIYTTIAKLEFLSQTFEIPIQRKLNGALIHELDELKDSLSKSKDGDNINLTFIPEDGNTSGRFKDMLTDKIGYQISFIDR